MSKYTLWLILGTSIPLWIWLTSNKLDREHDRWQRLYDQLGRIEQRLETVCPGSAP